MQNTREKILLAHGSGGRLSADLIKNIFIKSFDNPVLRKQTDSAFLELPSNRIAFTTDSYVVDPIFFPGGDIGKLAVCGTVNDLAVSGALPMYISASFIIEEGLLISDLERIVSSMAEEAKNAGVKIVTGDTKVVDKGKCDKVFINTAGVGVFNDGVSDLGIGENIKAGDKIIVNGTIADHGMAILTLRNELDVQNSIESDCACLSPVIQKLIKSKLDIKFMRDATRGGIAAVLHEWAEACGEAMWIEESKIPLSPSSRGICEMLGLDPLFIANEGTFVAAVAPDRCDQAMKVLSSFTETNQAAVVGIVRPRNMSPVVVQRTIGVDQPLDEPIGAMLPRIC